MKYMDWNLLDPFQFSFIKISFPVPPLITLSLFLSFPLPPAPLHLISICGIGICSHWVTLFQIFPYSLTPPWRRSLFSLIVIPELLKFLSFHFFPSSYHQFNYSFLCLSLHFFQEPFKLADRKIARGTDGDEIHIQT